MSKEVFVCDREKVMEDMRQYFLHVYSEAFGVDECLCEECKGNKDE